MKIDRDQLSLHAPWAVTACLLAVGLTIWYVTSSWTSQRWLGGSSPAGLACGIAAGAVILFEMLLWPRKFLRRWLLIPTRQWMAGHIWLGIISLPLAILHSGFHLGGALPATLMVLFSLTFLSGLFGLVMQNLIPKLSLRWLPAETIYSQIEHISNQNIQDLRNILTAACGPQGNVAASTLDDLPVDQRAAIVVGAIRQVGLVQGRSLKSLNVVAISQDREILWTAMKDLEPFLATGRVSASSLANEVVGISWFRELRRSCQPAARPIIDRMEEYYQQRHQFDLQKRLHHWLHVWLPIHVALSVAVSVLLVAHIYTALIYW